MDYTVAVSTPKKPSFKGGTFVRCTHLTRLNEIGVVMRDTDKGVRVHFADGIVTVRDSLLKPTKRKIELPQAAWTQIREEAMAEHTEYLNRIFPPEKTAGVETEAQRDVRIAAARGHLNRLDKALLTPENFLHKNPDGSFVVKSEADGPIQNAAANGQLHLLPREARTVRALLDCGHPDCNKPVKKAGRLEEGQQFGLGDGYTLTFFPGTYRDDNKVMIGDIASPGGLAGQLTVTARPGGCMVKTVRVDHPGKGLYRRSLQALADHLGSIQSDPDLDTNTAAEAAWEAVGARRTPSGQYILSRNEPENIHVFGNAFHAAIMAGTLETMRIDDEFKADLVRHAHEIEPSVDFAASALIRMANVVRKTPEEFTDFDNRAQQAHEWIENLCTLHDLTAEQTRARRNLPEVPSIPKTLPAAAQASGNRQVGGK